MCTCVYIWSVRVTPNLLDLDLFAGSGCFLFSLSLSVHKAALTATPSCRHLWSPLQPKSSDGKCSPLPLWGKPLSQQECMAVICWCGFPPGTLLMEESYRTGCGGIAKLHLLMGDTAPSHLAPPKKTTHSRYSQFVLVFFFCRALHLPLSGFP